MNLRDLAVRVYGPGAVICSRDGQHWVRHTGGEVAAARSLSSLKAALEAKLPMEMLISSREVGQLTGIRPTSLNWYVKHKGLPVLMKQGRKLVFDRDAVRAWIEVNPIKRRSLAARRKQSATLLRRKHGTDTGGLIGSDQVAKLIGLKAGSSVSYYVRHKGLPIVERVGKRRTLFDPTAVNTWLEKNPRERNRTTGRAQRGAGPSQTMRSPHRVNGQLSVQVGAEIQRRVMREWEHVKPWGVTYGAFIKRLLELGLERR